MSLERARSIQDVRASVAAFAGALAAADPKTRYALSHPTYWVYDAAADSFAPAKWAAFRDMTANRYDALLAEAREEPVPGFDGSIARRVIEGLTGRGFNRNPELLARLLQRFEEAFGAQSVAKNQDAAWRTNCRFVLLPGTTERIGSWALDPRLRADLEQIYQKSLGEDAVLSKEDLYAICARFADRFGPKALSNIDGEALLIQMHDHSTKESLVYWLEFKDDEEFPTGAFGGIAGGGAFKFGIYRSKGGEWIAGKKHKVGVEAAVKIAQRHRDQLVAGAALIAEIPEDAGDEQYAEVQRRLEEIAPDVQDTAWGHKYFTLLAPERLAPFHVEGWQRANLVRLLQVPPPTPGRYACEGRYVALARDLGLPLNHAARALMRRHGGPYAYRRLDIDDLGDEAWSEMQAAGVVGYPWGQTGSLDDSSAELLSEFKPLAAAACGWPEEDAARHAMELWGLWKFVAEGDLIVASKGDSVYGLGKVTGPYRFEPTSALAHQRPVKWLDQGTWTLPGNERLSKNLHFINDPGVQVAIERRLVEGPGPLPPPPPPMPDLEGVPGRVQRALARKGQVILYGPPGTGKTHWAERTAREIAAWAVFGRSFPQLASAEQKRILADGGGFVRLCSFHPAYGYEEFIEGYRPDATGGTLTFGIKKGVFRRICDDAAADPGHPYFLIIDEINRGDIPRIFGELITVLELSKREMPLVLPLTGEILRVPRNLYVIGTMNTADRSIALLDTALRRRFGFIELMPDPSVLGDASLEGIPLGRWLAVLNRRICEHIGRDARNLQVGHSYLMSGGKAVAEFAQLRRIIREDILPLLEEYCYDDWEAVGRILGNGLVDDKGQRFREELFETGRETDLIRALLAMDPSIEVPAVVEVPAETEADMVAEGGEPRAQE